MTLCHQRAVLPSRRLHGVQPTAKFTAALSRPRGWLFGIACLCVCVCVCRKTRRGRVERREVTMSDARACNHHVLRQSGSPRLRHRTTWVSHSTTRRDVRTADIPIRLWSHQSADCRGTSGPDLGTTSWTVAGTVRKYSQKVFKYKKNQNWILYFKYKIQ